MEAFGPGSTIRAIMVLRTLAFLFGLAVLVVS
jgi:hypothetical protein